MGYRGSEDFDWRESERRTRVRKQAQIHERKILKLSYLALLWLPCDQLR